MCSYTLGFVSGGMTCSNAPAPLELILSNQPAALDPFAANSILANIGNPQQQIQLAPSTAWWNVGLHATDACQQSTNNSCPSERGGIFDGSKSSTYTPVSLSLWNGTQNKALTPDLIYFNDDFQLAEGQRIDGLPMVNLKPGQLSPGTLPLGINSSFLDQGFRSRSFTSKSWGLYMGSPTTPGSLILGGYSTSFMDGTVELKSSPPDCPICFKVTEVSIKGSQGKITPILPPKVGGDFSGQFEPYLNYIGLPGSIWDDWVNITGAVVGPEGLPHYIVPNAPKGSLKITLGNGLVVDIPHDAFVTDTPPIINGKAVTLESGTKVARIIRSPGNNGILGLPFMSMVYLIFDAERKTLQVANAATSAASMGRITPICPESALPSPTQSHTTGLIVGLTVASIVVLLLLMGTGFLFVKRRQKQRQYRFTAAHQAFEKDSKIVFPTRNLSPSMTGTYSKNPWKGPPLEMSGEISPRYSTEVYSRETLPRELPVSTSTIINVIDRHGSNRSSVTSSSQDDEIMAKPLSSFSGSTLSYQRASVFGDGERTLLGNIQRPLSGGNSKISAQWYR